MPWPFLNKAPLLLDIDVTSYQNHQQISYSFSRHDASFLARSELDGIRSYRLRRRPSELHSAPSDGANVPGRRGELLGAADAPNLGTNLLGPRLPVGSRPDRTQLHGNVELLLLVRRTVRHA